MLFVIFFLLFVFFAEICLQNWWIKVMHKEKIEQVTKLYGPAWHEKTKLGTPTMGGVVFAAVALLCVPVIMLYAVDVAERRVLIHSEGRQYF